MSSSHRSLSYSIKEDIHLCHVYLNISQNPIVGINQFEDQFWARVEADYHLDSKFENRPRPKRSLKKKNGSHPYNNFQIKGMSKTN